MIVENTDMLLPRAGFFDNPEHYELLRTTPYWPNLCNHQPEEYVGSCSAYEHGARGPDAARVVVDVYVYGEDQHVCVRYGAGEHEYFSGRPLGEYILSQYAYKTRNQAGLANELALVVLNKAYNLVRAFR